MVSFVIPAHNEERLIGRTLAALRDATGSLGEPYEIIVVDDGSSDRTAAIARGQGARIVQVSHRHIAATRNAGARVARGDRLIFVDADTRVSGAVVRAAVAALEAGAVGGGCLVRFDEPLPTWARLTQPLLDAMMKSFRLAAGCFVFCTRAAFDAVGGFDERMYGAEEIGLSRALHRHGRFVVLRQTVISSGRKLRAYSGAEVFAIVSGLAARGRNAVASREGLEAWYGSRREDPQDDDQALSA